MNEASPRSRIGLDAMGGDHAPAAIVAGAVEALSRHDDIELLLVGKPDALEAELEKHDADRSRIEIVAASEVVEMHESPVEAIRRKPDSSLRHLVRLQKEGRTDAIFSAGNTGAMVAATTMGLGLLPGVRRAGIAVALPLPDQAHPVMVIDVGANVACKPRHLFQYAVMASEYIARVYGVENPKVGVLNVGEEEQKGTALVKETRDMLSSSTLNVIGNVEGSDVFGGSCDVIVCDGFVGNIVLKTAEGLAERMLGAVFSELKKFFASSAGSGLGEQLGPRLKEFAARYHYSEYGGAPLLGVDGSAAIGHGRSDSTAIANAIRWARTMVTTHVRESIVDAIAENNARIESA